MSDRRGEGDARVNRTAWARRTTDYAIVVVGLNDDFHVELHGGRDGPYESLVEVLNEYGAMGWHVQELRFTLDGDDQMLFLLSRRRS